MIKIILYTHPIWLSIGVSKRSFRPFFSPFHPFFLSVSSSSFSSSSILGIVCHFSFSISLPITLTSPPPTGGTPAVRKGRGTDYHVIHVTGTARDTQRYTVTRDTFKQRSNHFLSFTVPPFYLDPLDSRYLLFAEFPLFCYSFPLRSMENERRTRVANFLRSLTPVSLSLRCPLPHPNPLYLSVYFFLFLPPPFLATLAAASEERALPATTICRVASQPRDFGILGVW